MTKFASTFCREDTTKRRASKSKSFKDVENFEVKRAVVASSNL
jgi:hypothetical protein